MGEEDHSLGAPSNFGTASSLSNGWIDHQSKPARGRWVPTTPVATSFQGAPPSIHLRIFSVSWLDRGSPGGICPFTILRNIRLLLGWFGTMAGPLFPPLRMVSRLSKIRSAV